MIRYALACHAGHRFESWFGSSAAFDDLAGQGLVACPACGSTRVAKAIMAPAVVATPAGQRAAGGSTGASGLPGAGSPAPAPSSPAWLPHGADAAVAAARELRALARAYRAKVLAETQDVGARFPAEARRIHEGETPRRDIRGEATLDEARELLEDGILILPIPAAPDDLN